MDESTEHWLPVPEFEGFYEASTFGRIRSIRHMTAAGWRGGKILTPFLDGDGYLRVNLSRLGTVKNIPVHVIVLLTFKGAPEPGQQGRHGRGGKRDNSITNLCWGSVQDNSDDKYRDGTMACGEQQGNASLTTQDIIAIRNRRAAGELQRVLASEFRISQAHVSRITLRQSWTHVP